MRASSRPRWVPTIEDAKLDFAVDTSKARQYELGLKEVSPSASKSSRCPVK